MHEVSEAARLLYNAGYAPAIWFEFAWIVYAFTPALAIWIVPFTGPRGIQGLPHVMLFIVAGIPAAYVTPFPSALGLVFSSIMLRKNPLRKQQAVTAIVCNASCLVAGTLSMHYVFRMIKD